MTGHVLKTAVICVILLCFSDVFSAGIELTAIGARATAMGGNYKGIADDWSAMYWNPAGLVHTQGWNVGISLGYVMPAAFYRAGDSHYYNIYGDPDFRRFSVASQTEQPSERKYHVAPAAGISYSTGRMAFGIGLWVPMGWGAKWDLLSTADGSPDDFPGTPYYEYNSHYPEFEFESAIQLFDIHPTFSCKVSEKLSFGIGASIVAGKVWIRQPAFLQNPYLYDQTMYRTLLELTEEDDVAVLNQMRKPPFDHLINEAEMNSTGMAFGANVGVMYRFSDRFRIGVSLQYYSDFNASGDYNQTVYFGDAPLFQELTEVYDEVLFSRLHNGGIIDDRQYQILTDFYSGKVVPLVDETAELVIPLPMKAGIGVSYSGFDNLLLAVDFNYTRWSVWEIFTIKDLNGESLSRLPFNWSDTYKLGVGFEYLWGRTHLRGGFSGENRAAPDESVSLTIPDIGDRYTLNLGFALPVGSLQLALNFERIFIGEKHITTWAYDDMTIAQNMAGIYKVNANTLMLGLDYFF